MGLGHVDAVVLCGGLDVGEGLFALVVRHVLDLIEAADGVADVRGADVQASYARLDVVG